MDGPNVLDDNHDKHHQEKSAVQARHIYLPCFASQASQHHQASHKSIDQTMPQYIIGYL